MSAGSGRWSVIGAGAVVRGSVLADGAAVEDLALVEFSVLAPGARVQRQAMVKFSVLGANCAAGGLMQLGVLDRAQDRDVLAPAVAQRRLDGLEEVAGSRLRSGAGAQQRSRACRPYSPNAM